MAKDGRETKGKYVYALLELAETKHLNKITVKDLLDATGTARQTFYNYFKDINELIAYVYVYFFEEEYEKYFSPEGLKEVFERMKEYKAFYCQLPFHHGQNNYAESHLRWMRESYYRDALSDLREGSEEYVRRKVAIDGFLYGAVWIELDWLREGMAWSAEAIIDFIFKNKPDFIMDEPGPDFEVLPVV